MSIFFSVIIPTFNQADYLNKCLKSVLSQTFRNYEVIVIDNFSQDGTIKVINNFKNKIIYKKFKNNGVIAKSRNLGIKIARGKWISFLDSDDEWTKNKLEITHNKINENNKIDVICNDEWIIKGREIKLWSNGPYKKYFYEHMLRFGNQLSTSASSVKKNFLIKNNIFFNQSKNFITAEDYDFFLNIAKSKGNFFFISKPLGYHNLHSSSASAKNLLHKKSVALVLKLHSKKIDHFNKIKRSKFFSWCKLNLDLKFTLINLINLKNQRLKCLLSLIKKLYRNPVCTFLSIYFFFFKVFRNKLFFLIYKIRGL